MSERNLIAACLQDRAAYDAVEKYLDPKDFTEESRIILEVVGKYYHRDSNAKRCDPELIVRAVQNAVKNPKHKESLGTLAESLVHAEISTPNVVQDILEQRREAAGQRLASLLVGGEKKDGQIESALREYLDTRDAEELETSTAEKYCGLPVRELVDAVTGEGQLIRMYPKVLNDRLDGGLLRGHHVVVFARPEAGKTTFVTNLVYGFLQQGLKVLYICNEEPAKDTLSRVVCRLTLMTKWEVYKEPDKADEVARAKGYDKLTLLHLEPGTPREIEAAVIEEEPDVLIIDQLRNINMKEDQYVVKLEKAATAVRNIGQRHNCLVISVTQAGDSAENKAVLDMGDVDSSNTGIPAQADVMVGIGATQEDKAINRRVLSLPKNKRSGNHSAFPVRVDFPTARVTNG